MNCCTSEVAAPRCMYPILILPNVHYISHFIDFLGTVCRQWTSRKCRFHYYNSFTTYFQVSFNLFFLFLCWVNIGLVSIDHYLLVINFVCILWSSVRVFNSFTLLLSLEELEWFIGEDVTATSYRLYIMMLAVNNTHLDKLCWVHLGGILCHMYIDSHPWSFHIFH